MFRTVSFCLQIDFFSEGLSHIYAASNVVVFMSYTHWSINCQDSRDVFLELAREFSESDDETTEKVAFVAINCWLPKSQCRKVSRAIGPFPRFIIYIPELSRHVWYSGPVTVTAIRNEIGVYVCLHLRVLTRY